MAQGPTFQTILKVSDACNLNCAYCYYYTDEFNSRNLSSRLMSLDTAKQMLDAAARHATSHGLTRYKILFHGGEPLLWPIENFESLLAYSKALEHDEFSFAWSIQSNGVLLSDRHVELFKREHVAVSLSLDGPREFNDRYRVDRQGRSSFDAVLAAIEMLRSYQIQPAVLVTIDPNNDGGQIYKFLRSLGVVQMNFLLPDYNHDTVPYSSLQLLNDGCFDFMRAAFDLWLAEDDPKVSVMYFEEAIAALMGGDPRLCTMRKSCPSFNTVEIDGAMNNCDVMRLAGNTHYETGSTVMKDFDEFITAPSHRALSGGCGLLCSTCRNCEWIDACGGHCPGTRFSRSRGFDNVSIHCGFFKMFLGYVASTVSEQLPRGNLAT